MPPKRRATLPVMLSNLNKNKKSRGFGLTEWGDAVKIQGRLEIP
jgi:hypothetical protein